MGSAWDQFLTSYQSAKDEPPAQQSSFASGSAWGSLLDQYQPSRSPRPQQSGSNKVDEGYIREGLIKRGLPEHVADAAVMNFKDESGLDAGINERNPLVKGSRGGYGLYQLTGPRRRQYEALADSQGKAYNDVDLQLDFFVHELKTTEKRAGSKLAKTNSVGEAASVIVNDFLRPAKEHRISRTRKYLSGGQSRPAPKRIQSWNDLI